MSRGYWDRGRDAAPWITGASAVMDCADLKDALRGLQVGVPLQGSVLDVGCGTGRFAQCCAGPYHGVDISAGQVAYAQQAGRSASRIVDPSDLPAGPFDWVVCFSVFTHIDVRARAAYLQEFATRTKRLIVDVIPGDGTGDVALWTASPEVFRLQMAAAGWQVVTDYTRTSPDRVSHWYLHMEQSE